MLLASKLKFLPVYQTSCTAKSDVRGNFFAMRGNIGGQLAKHFPSIVLTLVIGFFKVSLSKSYE